MYIDADYATPNKNAVLAIPYSNTGVPLTKQSKQFPTGGTGTPYVTPLPNAVGTATGDHQVLLSSNKKLLFAVNQGSNSIAVFHVELAHRSVDGAQGLAVLLGWPGSGRPGLRTRRAGRGQPRHHRAVQPARPVSSRPVGPRFVRGVAERPPREVDSTAPDPDGLIDATIAPDGSEIVTHWVLP